MYGSDSNLNKDTKDLGLAVILLAAGKSQRFGSNKLLANIGVTTLIERTLQPFLSIGNIVKTMVIVTGAYTRELTPVLSKYPVLQRHNALYATAGMSSSVIIGALTLKELQRHDLSGIFIHPADVPFVSSDDLDSILEVHEREKESILIPTFGGKRGHPLLIPIALLDDLFDLQEANQGLRGFLKEQEKRIKFVVCPTKGIMSDIDSPTDLKASFFP